MLPRRRRHTDRQPPGCGETAANHTPSQKLLSKIRNSCDSMAENQTILLNTGPGSAQTFLQRGRAGGQHTYEKMLSGTDHRGHAHLSHPETSPHTCYNGHRQKDKKQVLARTWTTGDPRALSGGLQMGAARMENCVEVPQKPKNTAHLFL